MIQLRNIYKTYDNKEVIKNLSLDIEFGKTTVLMGISGGGKTTLANILLGLTEIDSGYITGLESVKTSAVFQEDRLSEKLSSIANVMLVLEGQVKKSDIINEFKKIGLYHDLLNKPVSNLSGGQRRRVAIVRAIMTRADFYCLDEPFKGLDEKTKKKTMNYIAENVKDKTSLIITHDIKVARFFNAKCISFNENNHIELLTHAME